MHDTRRAHWGAALAAGVLTLTLAVPAAAQDNTVEKIAYIAPEPATDFGWNEQGAVGAQAAADSVGGTVLMNDGIDYGPEAVKPILDQLAEEDVDLVIAQASGYNTEAPKFAAENNVPVLIFDNPAATTPGLVANVGTDNQDGGYLAGVLAATQSESGVLGIVLSAANDVNWLKGAGGFVEGARSVNPDVQFRKAVIDEFGYGDGPGGNRVTTQVIAAGADVIFGQGNGSTFGMLQAIQAADGVWFIDVIGDKSGTEDANVVLSSVLWDFGPTYTEAVADINDGSFGQENYVLNGANGGIKLLETEHWTEEGSANVAAAAAALADGSVTITQTPTADELDALIG